MADPKSSRAWKLRCPWCAFYIVVGGRGMRGKDPGAGIEAANYMRDHIEVDHDRTWLEFLGETVISNA